MRRGCRTTWVLGAVLVGALIATRWYRLNISPSVAYGIYRLVHLETLPSRGSLVLLPAPSAIQAWHSAWLPLLKPVAGVPGDRVCIANNRLVVRGEDYGPVLISARGQILSRTTACFTVQPGEVFLASRAPRSLDGRYFGPTPIATLTGAAVPVWTWGHADGPQ